MKDIQMIASGYEWICPDPDCGEFNKEIEVTEKVTCSHCKKEYLVADVRHAYK